MNQKIIIEVVLGCGDRFIYGGTKDINDLFEFMRWQTPTNIIWPDDKGCMHVFHSEEVKHIYTKIVSEN